MKYIFILLAFTLGCGNTPNFVEPPPPGHCHIIWSPNRPEITARPTTVERIIFIDDLSKTGDSRLLGCIFFEGDSCWTPNYGEVAGLSSSKGGTAIYEAPTGGFLVFGPRH
jgi:hypothetical protein